MPIAEDKLCEVDGFRVVEFSASPPKQMRDDAEPHHQSWRLAHEAMLGPLARGMVGDVLAHVAVVPFEEAVLRLFEEHHRPVAEDVVSKPILLGEPGARLHHELLVVALGLPVPDALPVRDLRVGDQPEALEEPIVKVLG